jgi:hypothetical protein
MRELRPGRHVYRVGERNKLVLIYLRNIRYAVGVISRRPRGVGKHYLMLDCDAVPRAKVRKVVELLKSEGCKFIVWYKTKHGYHIITKKVVSYREFAVEALSLGADPVWVGIGLKRGYWFLEVRRRRFLPLLRKEGFRLMVIERVDK